MYVAVWVNARIERTLLSCSLQQSTALLFSCSGMSFNCYKQVFSSYCTTLAFQEVTSPPALAIAVNIAVNIAAILL